MLSRAAYDPRDVETNASIAWYHKQVKEEAPNEESSTRRVAIAHIRFKRIRYAAGAITLQAGSRIYWTIVSVDTLVSMGTAILLRAMPRPGSLRA
jgi:hypothetical protein